VYLERQRANEDDERPTSAPASATGTSS